jgi:hypothetical protein
LRLHGARRTAEDFTGTLKKVAACVRLPPKLLLFPWFMH